jgi:hypothetical protein
MEPSLSRVQLRFVAASYAVVFVASALLVVQRCLVYLRNPQDVAAAGGMYAGGDLALVAIICFLFLPPTIALIFAIRKSEAAYTTYAKVLLALSLTAPLSVGLLALPIFNRWYWGDAIVFRLFAIPIFGALLIFSRLLARFKRAQRLISYAVMVEGLTFVAIAVAAVLFLSRSTHH